MPSIYENPRVAQWAIKEVAERMKQQRKDGIHISDLTGCLRKAVLARQHPEIEYSSGDILRFAQGYAIQEYFLGPEIYGKEFRGVLFGADRETAGAILEFKHTRKSYERKSDGYMFDPLDHPEWILRCACYCVAYGHRVAHILVFFKYAEELHAWTVEYTDEELAEATEFIDDHHRLLQEYLDDGTELPPRLEGDDAWMCGTCIYSKFCKGGSDAG